MATETKDAFESMNLSTEQLELALETAKTSDEHQLNEHELSQIEEMLSKLRSMFSESSKVITQPRAERGDVQSQKDLLDQVTNQYQAMNALVANMTQTLMGLEGVKDKFNQVFGGAEGLMANAEKAQKTPGASQLQLHDMFDYTRNSLDQCTESFKTQLNEQLALYEAIGAEYFQMQAAMKFIPNVPHTPAPAGDGDENNENTGNNDNSDNPENANNAENPDNTTDTQNTDISDEGISGNPDDLPTAGSENEQQFIPPPVTSGGTAAAAGSENEQQFIPPPAAAAAPAGGEQQGSAVGGSAPMGGGAAAPAGGEQQGSAVGGGAPMGGGAAAPAAAAPAAPEHPSSASAHSAQSQHSAMQQTEQADRGRKDERQKKSRRKKS